MKMYDVTVVFKDTEREEHNYKVKETTDVGVANGVVSIVYQMEDDKFHCVVYDFSDVEAVIVDEV